MVTLHRILTQRVHNTMALRPWLGDRCSLSIQVLQSFTACADSPKSTGITVSPKCPFGELRAYTVNWTTIHTLSYTDKIIESLGKHRMISTDSTTLPLRLGCTKQDFIN